MGCTTGVHATLLYFTSSLRFAGIDFVWICNKSPPDNEIVQSTRIYVLNTIFKKLTKTLYCENSNKKSYRYGPKALHTIRIIVKIKYIKQNRIT